MIYINRKFEIFITFLQPGMKTFKDSKDLISSCHHHLSEKVSLFSSNNEHLSKYVMIFLQSIYDKNFLHEVTIYHRKKTKGYFGIDKDNTCSNENLVWDFWVIGRIHLPLMDGLLVKSFIKETFLFFIQIQ